MTLRDRRPPNLRHLDRLYVGGAWVEPATASTIEVVDPATEVPYYRVAEAQAPDVDAAVTAARAAFDGGVWPRIRPTERAAYLRAMAAALARRGEDIGELWARQAGAVYDVATQFAIRMAGLYDMYAGLADTFAFEQEVPALDPTLSGLLVREPVSQHRHDQLAESLAAAFSRVRVGDPLDSATEMGPLATRRQRDRVLGYVEQGVAAGAKLLTGGGRPAHLDRGWYVEPTVFAGVDNGSTIAQEEIFGPVLSVIPAADERDAVRIANDSLYGLNAAVYTHDAERARWVARALRTGTVGQNGSRTDVGIAVGGCKQSGIGREGGVEGLLPYLETKTVLLSEPRSRAASTPAAATTAAR